MRRVLKWIGIVLGVIVGLVVLAAVVLSVIARTQLNRTYDVEAATITIPDDDASLARGEHLVDALCTGCHGDDLTGELMFEEPGIAAVYAPNITPSEAGVGGYSDADYVRAIRNGVSPDGEGYFIMPAEVFIHWSEEDLGATIAYLKTLPPDDNVTPDKSFGVMGSVLYGAGMFGDLVPAAYIDHDAPPPAMPEVGANAEYGEYFTRAFACTVCHRDDMQGGPQPASIPDVGEIPPAVQAGAWSTEEFITLMTTGVKPNGDQIDTDIMSPELYEKFDEEELAAVHLYLQTLLAE